ncbi:MAG: S46 family peptidase [Proteobacteria bacterium]|nr:S46 family peptidase [Pseudomonadota bacterium]MCP4921187.1 S46 family peptidase [Pseudomonadota bacterium]
MLILLSSLASADEGMWLPEQLPGMSEQLTVMGLEVPAEQLADTSSAPLGAIISLGEYCSASFLSAEGLVGTNHHCVSGLLQYNSDAENNRAIDGYVASDRASELSGGPTARMYVVDGIEDVTEVVNKKVRRWTKDAQRYELVEQAKKELIAECEQQPNHRCLVSSYYGGQQYRLISRLEIKDVRIVYAPADSVGNYGDEIDNWMWPRHSGDFSLVRAYVAPDGSSAEYSEDNVPYSPPHHLEIAAEGIDDGDFVMVAGYPGSTYRYRTARSLQFAADVSYPFGVELAEEILAILRAESDKSEDAAARLRAPIGWVGNGLKYRQGNLDAFTGTDVVADKQAGWDELVAWVEADPIDTKIYGPVLDELDAMQAETESRYLQEVTLGYATWLATDLSNAHRIYRWTLERQKPDLERDRGYQDRDRDRVAARFAQQEQTIWRPADRELLGLMLGRLEALPADQHIAALDAFVADLGGIDGTLDALYADTALVDSAGWTALMDASPSELQTSDNPWIQLAVALEDGFLAENRALKDVQAGAGLRLNPLYMEALLQSQESVYPDANNSLRVTVGHVKGYSPADAIHYAPNTTLSGMVAKAGEWPYNAPENLLEAAAGDRTKSGWYDADLGDVPVNFLSTLDSTGGNSGSATLNAQGQMVGFLFDGNYEAMSADWVFDDALTRSIHVDIRYALWVLENDGAGHILDEMSIVAGTER